MTYSNRDLAGLITDLEDRVGSLERHLEAWAIAFEGEVFDENRKLRDRVSDLEEFIERKYGRDALSQL